MVHVDWLMSDSRLYLQHYYKYYMSTVLLLVLSLIISPRRHCSSECGVGRRASPSIVVSAVVRTDGRSSTAEVPKLETCACRRQDDCRLGVLRNFFWSRIMTPKKQVATSFEAYS